jgi:hypothetical protein
MRTRPLLHTIMAIAATSLVFGCADDELPPGAEEVGDGDGDGEPTGDGDGEPAGDGDGEPAGDGDGEPAGDGDGEPAGDGDGEPADQCQTIIDTLAAEFAQPDGGCSVLVRFKFETFEPIEWTKYCAPYSDAKFTEEDARKRSECCGDGTLLGAGEPDQPFVFYSKPEPEGGVTVVSNHLGERTFEATIKGMMGTGNISHPKDWKPADKLGSECAATPPAAIGYDLSMDGAELDKKSLDAVLTAFADTAVVPALEQHGKIYRTLVLEWPQIAEPFDPAKAEYVVIVESGVPREDEGEND